MRELNRAARVASRARAAKQECPSEKRTPRIFSSSASNVQRCINSSKPGTSGKIIRKRRPIRFRLAPRTCAAWGPSACVVGPTKSRKIPTRNVLPLVSLACELVVAHALRHELVAAAHPPACVRGTAGVVRPAAAARGSCTVANEPGTPATHSKKHIVCDGLGQGWGRQALVRAHA